MTDSPPASRTGPRNLITDVEGLSVGSAHDEAARTGVTVILADRLTTAACEVLGGGPGTRETDALKPENLVGRLDAITLAGGSVYGLAAAEAVTSVLGSEGRGFRVRDQAGVPASPLVGGAILYDLANGGDKAWGDAPPYAVLAKAALKAAAPACARWEPPARATGASAGTLKGGLGSALGGDPGRRITVGALVAVSTASARWWGRTAARSGPRPSRSAMSSAAPTRPSCGRRPTPGPTPSSIPARLEENTTLAVVATDVDLTPAELKRVAIMASAGLARAIRPVFAPFDGDVVFALSTARRPAPEPRPLAVARIGALAADALARAIARGVFEARAWPGSEPKDWKTVNGSMG